ncbi:MAG: carboxypeptidase-like regulatory domain-containing protein [Pirellulales bacterium]
MQRSTRFDLLAVGICSLMMAVPESALAVEYQRAASRDLPHSYGQTATGAGTDASENDVAIRSQGAEPSLAVYAIADIELHERGTLVGHLADPTGNPLAGQQVLILKNQVQIGAATTDSRGRFAVSNLRGGVYEVSSAGTSRLLRVWVTGTAPPIAQTEALLVIERTIVRGQSDRRRGAVTRFLHNPWVLATLVGAAIAIPIGISINDKDLPPPAS